MNSKLIISDNKVQINTDIVYSAIELFYNGDIRIKSLLPNDYLVKSGKNKILIIRVNTDNAILSDLFLYDGLSKIYGGYIYNKKSEKYKLTTEIVNDTSWSNLEKKDDLSEKYDWDNLTSDYEEMKGHREKKQGKRLVYKSIDGENKRTYVEKEAKYNYNYKENKFLGNQYTHGNKYRIKGTDKPYEGYYYINLQTLKLFTGEEPNENIEELLPIKTKTSKIKKTGSRGY